MKEKETELMSDDYRYDSFCEAFRSGVLAERVPDHVAEKALKGILKSEKQAHPSARKGNGRPAVLALAACFVLVLCTVPFLPPPADAQVVTVNKTSKISQRDIEYIGHAENNGNVMAQFEVDLRWDGIGVSAVAYSTSASAVTIWLIDETFSQVSWPNLGTGAEPVARYSYKEGASLYARCLLSVAVESSGEVDDKEIETLGREALSGVAIEAAAELEDGGAELASSRIE